MKVLVTGATGFIGSHVAQLLAAQGANLRLLVRASSNSGNISDLKAERIVGDLRDSESLRKAVQGCEFVFHLAANADVRFGAGVGDLHHARRSPDRMNRAANASASTSCGFSRYWMVLSWRARRPRS